MKCLLNSVSGIKQEFIKEEIPKCLLFATCTGIMRSLAGFQQETIILLSSQMSGMSICLQENFKDLFKTLRFPQKSKVEFSKVRDSQEQCIMLTEKRLFRRPTKEEQRRVSRQLDNDKAKQRPNSVQDFNCLAKGQYP